jgi:hypothetical protein
LAYLVLCDKIGSDIEQSRLAQPRQQRHLEDKKIL